LGFIATGSFEQGWTLLDGELLPSDLTLLGLEPDAPPAEYKRGVRAPRFPRDSDVPAAEQAEVDNKVQRAASEATMYNAFVAAGESLGLNPGQIQALFAEIVKPIPEPALSIACSEGHHFAADFPPGCCMGKRLDDDYAWHRCECDCHEGQEVKLP